MATIGHFTKMGEDFEGTIVTLTINRFVRFIHETKRSNENSPSHRIFASETGGEIGAAWPQRTSDNRAYLSVKLDDPSFTAPVSAMLFEDEDGGHSLHWSRPRRQDPGGR